MSTDTIENNSFIRMEIPFFQTPNSIFDLEFNVIEVTKEERIERKLKAHEKLVYIYLCRCANNNQGQAFPSYNKIAKTCCISRRSAINAIDVLKENKLIYKKIRLKKDSEIQDTNQYFISNFTSESHALPSAPVAPTPVHDMHPRSAPDAPKKELYKKNYIKKDIYSLVINYLNQKAGTNYRATTKKTMNLINVRIGEKFTEEDFYKVIDNKISEWKGTDFEKYLRPETLFGTKFENYLNQKVGAKGGGFRKNTESENKYEGFKPQDPKTTGDIDPTDLI